MLLERILVKNLNDYNFSNDSTNKDDFINYALKAETKWLKENYPCFSEESHRRTIRINLDDCIAYEFIDSKGDNLRVTEKGRDFLKILGFTEEFLKRRKRTVVIPGSVILGALAAFLANYFINK